MARNYTPVRRDAVITTQLGNASQASGLSVALSALNRQPSVRRNPLYGNPTFFSEGQETARDFLKRTERNSLWDVL
jgi:hypothetical protein